ncbi:MAG: hypothetical protein WC569_04885 [Candidatus Omnitrophota bacterium]
MSKYMRIISRISIAAVIGGAALVDFAHATGVACLRAPINSDHGRVYISMLTGQVKSGADILKILRPPTREIFDILAANQRKSKEEILRSLLEKHAVKFDVMLFCEIYVVCKFYDWDSHRQLKYLAAERSDFTLQMIIHAAVLEKLQLSSREMSVLDRYISAPDDRSDETADPELSAKAISVILSKRPKRDYDVLSRYLGALSAMALEEKSGYGLLDIYIAARETADTGSRRGLFRGLKRFFYSL